MPDSAPNIEARSAELPAARPGNHFFYLTALTFLTIAAALRICHLGDRSLWFGDAFTAGLSRTTLTQMLLQQRARGGTPLIHPFVMYAVQNAAETETETLES